MTQTKDMTIGNPSKLIVGFGLPLLVGNILQQLYNMVDTIVVGRGIGVDALAAVGATGSINFLVLGFIMGMAQGVSILASQFFGSKDYRRLRQSITMSLYISIVVCIVVTTLSLIFTRPLLSLMGTPDNILDDAVSYIRIIFICITISYAYNFFSGILRAVGDSRNPVIAMVIACIVNIVLDVWFVMGLKIGVEGAAYATVIAQAFSAIYCFISYLRIEETKIHKEDWNMNYQLLKESFVISLPVAIMNSITAVGVMVLQAGINKFGTEHIAAYSAASKIMMILEQIGSTFGYACSTFVGQNLGAKKLDRILKGVNQMALVMGVFHIFLGIVMMLVTRWILTMMIGADQLDVVDYGVQYMRINYMFIFILSLLWIYRCSLQAMGDTVLPMVSGIMEFFSRIIFTMTLPGLLGFDGIALAEVSAWCAACIILIPAFYYRHNKIKKSILTSSEL